jgi:hypothetical protein
MIGRGTRQSKSRPASPGDAEPRRMSENGRTKTRTDSPKVPSGSDLRLLASSSGAESGAFSAQDWPDDVPIDPDLMAVVRAWPRLSADARRVILAAVAAEWSPMPTALRHLRSLTPGPCSNRGYQEISENYVDICSSHCTLGRRPYTSLEGKRQ